MKPEIEYVGFVGHQNIGDEAIFEANKRLFSQYELVPYQKETDSEVLLFGGGTMLPAATAGYRDYSFDDSTYRAATGVGVQDPSFHNRNKKWMDVSRYLGRRDIDASEIVRRAGKFGRLLEKLSGRFDDPIGLNRLYFTRSDYETIGEFGFDTLGVRGPDSKRIVEQYTDLSPRVVGDTAIHLEPSEYRYEPTNRIAVCLRGGGDKWSDDSEYVESVVEVCNTYSDTYEFVLLPFYPPDRDLHQELNEQIRNTVVKDFTSPVDIQGVLDEIAHTDLMIGEKLHANVLSACCHVPMISLEYRPKNLDFMRHLGLEAFNTRVDRVTTEVLEQQFERAVKNREIQDQLRTRVAEIRTGLESFVDEIRQDVESNTPLNPTRDE